MGLVISGSDLWQEIICMKFVLKISVVCGVWAAVDLTQFDVTQLSLASSQAIWPGHMS